MARTLENAAHPKALANTAKHFALTRYGELNMYGMVDAQIAALEGEWLVSIRICKSTLSRKGAKVAKGNSGNFASLRLCVRIITWDYVPVAGHFHYQFEWDPRKARQNLKRHGVAFERAATIFVDRSALLEFDEAHSETEESVGLHWVWIRQACCS